MQHIKRHKKHLWQGVGLALFVLAYSALPLGGQLLTSFRLKLVFRPHGIYTFWCTIGG